MSIPRTPAAYTTQAAAATWTDTNGVYQALVVQAEEIKIVDQASMERAVEFRRGLKRLIEEIREEYKGQKQAIDASKRVVLDKEKARLALPEEAKELVDQKLERWDAKQRQEHLAAEIAAAREAKETGIAVPAPPPAKVDGFGFSTHYKYVVLDKVALMLAASTGKFSTEIIEVNDALANDWARMLGPNTKAAEKPGTVVPMPGVPGLGLVAERRPRGK